MGCCKANKFGEWCTQEDASSVDREGKRYCIFHTPKEVGHFRVEEFNEKIYQLIDAAIAEGRKCNLSGTVFPGPISFNQYDEDRALPLINFTSAIFRDNVDFSGATFGSEAIFHKATFSGESDFRLAKFQAETVFSDALFCKQVTFARAIFCKHVAFQHTEFRDEAFFEGWLQEKTFRGSALFQGTRTEEGKIYFRGIKFQDSRVSFRGTSLSNFRFEGCAWPRKKPSLFQRIMPAYFANPEDTEVFYDEIRADRNYRDTSLFRKVIDKRGVLAGGYGVVENLYRQMKQQAKENHNEPDASRWHYREKEMYRKKNLLRRYFGVSFFYWALSGYGERPFRAGIVLVLLFIAIGVAMNGIGLHASNGEVIQKFYLSPDLEKVGKVTQAVIEHSLFVKDPVLKALPGFGSVFFTLWTKILIPVQAALFTFALRNKFRR